ncbi:winged helix-turn-helix transcriptional regulator [Rhodococcus sp. KBS0724]|uniref:MarR family winged helix-turn-helix transcriptional regulator n=1 Tax=Rhodococcus sp. KBS0724 TaxID=1179674 RepID=UPI00110D8712|nr:MarR family winged helix-turn-helix transcriptional regulator [Rhodococcus sp. KBS0724]TSD45570.1 winged helix-turn-helix transcriptional regulator [Rhodococcus sp. KBS0724]
MPIAEDASRSLIASTFELRRALREYMDPSGTDETLPEAQSEVIHDIAHHPGTRIGAVARRLAKRPNTVSTLVRILTDKDLIERRPDPSDGRVSTLYVKDERSARRDRRTEQRIHALAGELSHLTPEDVDTLIAASRILDSVNYSLRVHAPRVTAVADSQRSTE